MDVFAFAPITLFIVSVQRCLFWLINCNTSHFWFIVECSCLIHLMCIHKPLIFCSQGILWLDKGITPPHGHSQNALQNTGHSVTRQMKRKAIDRISFLYKSLNIHFYSSRRSLLVILSVCYVCTVMNELYSKWWWCKHLKWQEVTFVSGIPL